MLPPAEGTVLVVAHTLPYGVKVVDNEAGAREYVLYEHRNHPAAFAAIGLSRVLFVGWPGVCLADGEERCRAERSLAERHCLPVWLDSQTADLHLKGYCKERLWPLLHYSLWERLPEVTRERDMWAAYQAVNQAFAAAVLQRAAVRPCLDRVIVLDYHLMLLPGLIRAAASRVPLAFFLKTVFPSSEYIRCLPQARPILQGVLGADLVGFQTDGYARHFASCCLRILGLDMAKTSLLDPSKASTGAGTGVGIEAGIGTEAEAKVKVESGLSCATGRVVDPADQVDPVDSMESGNGNASVIDNGGVRVQLTVRPMGINVERVEEARQSYGVLERLVGLRAMFGAWQVILGIDRVDQLRGVLHKLRAVQLLLQDHPELVGKIVLVQVCVPDNGEADRECESQVNQLVNEINARFGALEYCPVHYHQRDLGSDEYYALLSLADVFVNSVERDGYSPTPLEYLLCQGQDGSRFGPLVLSEFTGMADALPEALIINPWHTKLVAQAIYRGVSMPDEERRQRHAECLKCLQKLRVQEWATGLQTALSRSALHPENSPTPFLHVGLLQRAYRECVGERIIFLDYDGTLTPIVAVPSEAQPAPRTIALLERLAADPQNRVFVISGRDRDSLGAWLGGIPNLGLSAEHGCYLHEPESGPIDTNQAGTGTEQAEHQEAAWERTVSGPESVSWRDKAMSIFAWFTERTPGSHIEQKSLSLTWHYRQADPDLGAYQAADCLARLTACFGRSDEKTPGSVDIITGKKNIEVRPAAANKGHIIRMVLSHCPTARFCFCAGDDVTDEDMFAALSDDPGSCPPDTVFTCTIGSASKRTRARYHVNRPEQIISFLESLLESQAAEPTAE